MPSIQTILSWPLEKRKSLFIRARKAYYNDPNGRTLLSDDDFDRLEESIKSDDPKWSELKNTGVSVGKKKKVPLEFKMPSLDKVKPDTVQKFLAKNSRETINVSLKLDGTSVQVQYLNGVPFAAYTRGNGSVGGDISFLLPHLKIPKRISYKKKLVLRCEGIFTSTVFKRYEKEFDAARNAASGLLNRMGDNVHPAIRNLDLVVVRVLDPRVGHSKGLALAKKWGFTVVPNTNKSASSLNANNLSKLLDTKKVASKWQLDGLVLTVDRINPRDTADKPDYAVAFKTNLEDDEAPEATVEDVVWQISSFGLLIPKVILSPTQFEGAVVTKATVNNAKWMIDRKIGPGAVVRLIRSGEIIPKIVKVIKPGKIKMPAKSVGAYAWDKNGTHLVLTDAKTNDSARIRGLTRFFKGVGIDFIGPGVAAKLYQNGYDTVMSIIKAKESDFLSLPGVQERGAKKLYESVQTLYTKGVTLPDLMEASGLFPRGMGSKRIAQIEKRHPDLIGLASLSQEDLLDTILQIPMFSDTMASAFVEGIYKFAKWFKRTGIKVAQVERVRVTKNKLNGLKVSWTGYRSDEQEKAVQAAGGEVISFSSKTQVLLYSPTGKASTKVTKAQDKGIQTFTWDKFSSKYGV